MEVFLKRKRMNNGGSTLIEIVISILIVGIVFVPLLMGLNTALKANAKSKTIMNAETVATNCLETVKAVGLKKLQGYYEKTSVNPLNSKIADQLGGEFTAAYTANEFSDGALLAGRNDTYHRDFVITNLEQGSGEYYATIEFNDDRFAVQNNNSDYVSIMGIGNKENSCLLNMSSTQDLYYSGLASGVSSVTADDVPDYIKSKTTEIVIDSVPADAAEHAEGICITAKNVYEFKTVEGGLPFSSPNPENGNTEVYYDKGKIPNTILLFYAPVYKDADKIKMMNDATVACTETIKVTKLYEGELSIYVFVKGANVKSSYSGDATVEEGYKDPFTGNIIDPEYANASLKFDISGDGCITKPLGLYSPIKVDLGSTVDYFVKPMPSIVSTASDDDFLKLYEVKISVYDLNGELLTQKTSTIMDGELSGDS